MDQITRDRLFQLVWNAIAFAAKADKRDLERQGILDGPGSVDRVTKRVCDQIDNERRAVVQIAPDPGIPFTELCDAPPRQD